MASGRARHAWGAALGITTVLLSACGRSPVTPATPFSPIQNASPAITSLSVGATRTEVGRDVPIIATVDDPDTPAGNLLFYWSANAGQFTGTGPSVAWRVAPGVTTPFDATVTLDVVDRYDDIDATGHRIVSEHRVERTAAPIRVHDSPAEISRIAVSFLVDYFGRSSVSAHDAVVDFSDRCPGKAEEESDVAINRATFVILDASAHVEHLTFNDAMTWADVVAPCVFHDRRIDNGQLGTTDGECLLTSTYDAGRWWLCDSHFRFRETN